MLKSPLCINFGNINMTIGLYHKKIQPIAMITHTRMWRTVACAGLACLCMSATEPTHKPTIFMIGDSTMANKTLSGGNQERGWGQMLSGFLDNDIVVSNHAVNGRSSKSFIDEGRWDTVLGQMCEGDYLIIQFGHNDEKADSARHTDPGTTYNANLRRFVEGAREKGATPIICNSIVRRNFAKVADAVAQDDAAGQSEAMTTEGDSLIETHGEYLTAARQVAEETQTIFIDMNKLTHDLVQGLGPIESRRLFVWAEPNTVAHYPKGKQDNTHLNIGGARTVARLAAKEMERLVPGLAPHIQYPDIVVAKDGSGDFFTIQEAVMSVPDYSKNRRTTILVNEGTYREKVVVPESKINLTLTGKGDARIEWGDWAQKKNRFGDDCSTSGSATFYVYSANFQCEGMTFANTAGRVGQAVACFVSSNNCVFRRCRFLGNQDTLYTYGEGTKQTYKECYIEGTVDFIFGKAAALFDQCEIHSLGDGYVCAPATPKEQEVGYVFNQCRLTAESEAKRVFLGRPWRPYAKAIYIDCHMDGHIVPAGWDNWGNKANEKTATFGEYQSSGLGSQPTQRAKWATEVTKPSKWLNYWIEEGK